MAFFRRSVHPSARCLSDLALTHETVVTNISPGFAQQEFEHYMGELKGTSRICRIVCARVGFMSSSPWTVRVSFERYDGAERSIHENHGGLSEDEAVKYLEKILRKYNRKLGEHFEL